MAVKNGSLFIREQIDSILPQLSTTDELVVSDDRSTDDTLSIVQSYQDSRIRIITNSQSGIVSNFENGLGACSGEFIFLCDQDDVWHEDKIAIMLIHLKNNDVVVSDCVIIGQSEQSLTFFKLNKSGKGLMRNLLRNSYMGCCMAFHRSVLYKALPFPDKIPMHDLWIGLIGELFFRVKFIPQVLVYHRRHQNNASTTSRSSNHSLIQKLKFRFQLIKNLVQLSHA